MSSASSPWSQKLASRLSALADGASKESLQTLAKWMGFNRKHGAALATALSTALKDASPARQWLYLQTIHEVLLLEEANASKWEKLLDLRVLLGETVIVPFLESSSQEWEDKLLPLCKQWDNHNVFGGPTLVVQIRKLLTEKKQETPTKEDATPSTAEVVKDAAADGSKAPTPEEEEAVPSQGGASTTEDSEVAKDVSNGDEKVVKEEEDSPPKRRGSAASQSEEVTFDFEATEIPFRKVEAREFLEPCKAIATLQIARDLRNDAAVQLSSHIQNLPPDVKQLVEETSNQDEPTISKERAQQMAQLLSEDLLDTNMEEAVQNIETFLDIVKRQREARERLIQLLCESRCRFGSEEAAQVFGSVQGILERLKTRKAELSDAMDLEGVFFQDKVKDETEEVLAPFSWFTAGVEGEEEPEAKRTRID